GSTPYGPSTRRKRWADRHEKMIMVVRSMSTGEPVCLAWCAAPKYVLRCSLVATYSGVRDVNGEDDLGPDYHTRMSDGVSDSRHEWVRVRREQQDVVEPPSMSETKTRAVL